MRSRDLRTLGGEEKSGGSCCSLSGVRPGPGNDAAAVRHAVKGCLGDAEACGHIRAEQFSGGHAGLSRLQLVSRPILCDDYSGDFLLRHPAGFSPCPGGAARRFCQPLSYRLPRIVLALVVTSVGMRVSASFEFRNLSIATKQGRSWRSPGGGVARPATRPHWGALADGLSGLVDNASQAHRQT
jgi:hypothetical protein